MGMRSQSQAKDRSSPSPFTGPRESPEDRPPLFSLAARDRSMYARVKMVMEQVDRLSRPEPTEPPSVAERAFQACKSAREDLESSIKRPLLSLRWYSGYDAVWERVAEIRHELCELLGAHELSVLELEIKADIDGYVEPEAREAALHELEKVMGAIQAHDAFGKPFDHLRADLKRLSVLGGSARQVCWRQVNRLRGRLLVSCVLLSLLLGLLICILPAVLTGLGTSMQHLFLAAVFGAAGGLLSGLMVRESSVLPSRVFYVEELLLAMRPIVGALSGLLLYLLQVTHAFPIGPSGDDPGHWPFFLAFAGGFSERLLLARLASATARAEREVSKADSTRPAPQSPRS